MFWCSSNCIPMNLEFHYVIRVFCKMKSLVRTPTLVIMVPFTVFLPKECPKLIHFNQFSSMIVQLGICKIVVLVLKLVFHQCPCDQCQVDKKFLNNPYRLLWNFKILKNGIGYQRGNCRSSFIDINVSDYWIINKLIVPIQKKPSLVTNIGHLLHL